MVRCAFLIVLLAVSTAAAGSFGFDFDDAAIGPVHSGLTVATGAWQVRADNTAPSAPNVLVQAAQNEGSDFNIIVADEVELRELEITVRFKSLSGIEDQGGGPVWRYIDVDNYYIARYNPLEDNFRLYRVVNGHRKMLKSVTIAATPGWHDIGVSMTGNHIECSYDGQVALKTEDDTFTKAGQVGLWTKADAVTAFDDLEVTAAGGKSDE